MLDQDWPHQVALPAYRCMGHNYRTVHFFCEELSLSPRMRAFRRHAVEMLVLRFGGEILARAMRPSSPGMCARRSNASAELRLRNGRCINCGD
jgi:hypothetical protein